MLLKRHSSSIGRIPPPMGNRDISGMEVPFLTRAIVILLESPYLDQLYNRISLLLSEYANNEKKFLPHITIARVRNRNSIPDISRLPTGEGMLPINELCLFKSILTREGSIYERIWCNEFY